MLTRQEIKQRARETFAAQRGTGILLFLAPFLILFAVALFFFIPFLGWFIYCAAIPVMVALSVGICEGYLRIYRGQKTGLSILADVFNVNFARKLGGMLWCELFVFLWALLFYIPGIVKALAYSMTPYILAEYPEVQAKQALKLSMRMTKGFKGDLFVLYLSFIGWNLLSGLTFGILSIVYVEPYFYTSMAGYYDQLRDNALRTGAIAPEELGQSRLGPAQRYEGPSAL